MRSLFALSVAACLLFPACSLHSSADDVSWNCTDTKVLDTACRCQVSPIGGNVHITDHCDRSMVQHDVGDDVVCCKQWYVLNGARQKPYLCYCNPSSSNNPTCDVAGGDEVVDRCP